MKKHRKWQGLIYAVVTLFAICSLIGCDPHSMSCIYFLNSSSDNCVIYLSENYHYPFQDTLVIKQGEKVFFFSDGFVGWASKKRAQDAIRGMRKDSGGLGGVGGIRIVFEKGRSINYSPDSLCSQTHSPYDENSYSYEFVNRHQWNATYTITDLE